MLFDDNATLFDELGPLLRSFTATLVPSLGAGSSMLTALQHIAEEGASGTPSTGAESNSSMPNPSSCKADLRDLVSALARAQSAKQQGSVDCVGPFREDNTCAIDLLLSMESLAESLERMTAALLDCGGENLVCIHSSALVFRHAGRAARAAVGVSSRCREEAGRPVDELPFCASKAMQVVSSLQTTLQHASWVEPFCSTEHWTPMPERWMSYAGVLSSWASSVVGPSPALEGHQPLADLAEAAEQEIAGDMPTAAGEVGEDSSNSSSNVFRAAHGLVVAANRAMSDLEVRLTSSSGADGSFSGPHSSLDDRLYAFSRHLVPALASCMRLTTQLLGA